MNFNVENLINALPMMGKGMLGIFVALVVIMAFVWIMAKMGSKKTEEEK